jgi:site-specific DNA-methyltransferase (adenine-specific)
MKPYYSENGIQIFHADCRDVLPSLGRFDLLLTDPPYGIGVSHNMGRRAGDLPSRYEKADWDKEPPSQETFDAMFAASENQIIWGANHFMDLICKRASCWLVWNKLFSEGVSFASCELAWTSHKGVVKRFDKSSQRQNGLHPTQKPLALMRWCLSFFPDAQTVIDTHMGSGTTLDACKQEGKQCVGIEINERYCESAAKRLSQQVFEFEECNV